jgi:hypothetical protein
LAEAHTQTPTHDAPEFDPATILKRNDPIFSLGVITFGLVLITYGGVMVLGTIRNAEIKRTNKEIVTIDNEIKTNATLSDTLKKYMGLDTVVKHVLALMNSRYKFNDSWNVIKSNTPKDMRFTALTMGSDNTYFITGQTKSVTSVANFAEKLGKEPGITNVAPTSIDKQDPKSNVMEFSIRFKVSKAAKKGDS